MSALAEYWEDASLPRDSLSRAAERLKSRGSLYLGGGVGAEVNSAGKYRVIGGGTHDGPLSAVTQALTLAGSKQAPGTPGGMTAVTDPAVAARVYEIDSRKAECEATIRRMERNIARRAAREKTDGTAFLPQSSMVTEDKTWDQRRIDESKVELAQLEKERADLLAGKVQEAWSPEARAAALLARRRKGHHGDAVVSRGNPGASRMGPEPGTTMDKPIARAPGRATRRSQRAPGPAPENPHPVPAWNTEHKSDVKHFAHPAHRGKARMDTVRKLSPYGRDAESMHSWLEHKGINKAEYRKAMKKIAEHPRNSTSVREAARRNLENAKASRGVQEAEVGKPGTNWKQVTPAARKKVDPLVKHWMSKPHPFTACVAELGPEKGVEAAKRICAVVKDMGMQSTHWRKGGKKVKEAVVQEFSARLLEAADGDLECVERYLLKDIALGEQVVPEAPENTPEGKAAHADIAADRARRRRREAVLGRTTAGTPGDVDAGGYGVSESIVFCA